MKEIRPSTWALLGVMGLFIVAPVFMFDVDEIEKAGTPADNGLRPTDTRPARPAGNSAPARNAPANTQPAANHAPPPPRENGLLD